MSNLDTIRAAARQGENDPVNANRHSYLSPKIEVRYREGYAGLGAFATDWIFKGELVSVWSGFIVNVEQFSHLPEEIARHTVQVEEDLYLASWTDDEPSDYVNHSCDPNTGVDGQLSLVALRDIAPGEEVTFDYAMTDGTPYDEFLCDCRASNCRYRITGDDWKRPELWKRYEGHFSPYLQRRIDRLRMLEQPVIDRVETVAQIQTIEPAATT